MIERSSHVSAELGENVTMKCIANVSTIFEWAEYTESGTRSRPIIKRAPLSRNPEYNNFHIQSDNQSYWNLIIEYTSYDDEGIYACLTGLVKWRYNLTVFGKFASPQEDIYTEWMT